MADRHILHIRHSILVHKEHLNTHGMSASQLLSSQYILHECDLFTINDKAKVLVNRREFLQCKVCLFYGVPWNLEKNLCWFQGLNYSFDKTIKIKFREGGSPVLEKYGDINYNIIRGICQSEEQLYFWYKDLFISFQQICKSDAVTHVKECFIAQKLPQLGHICAPIYSVQIKFSCDGVCRTPFFQNGYKCVSLTSWMKGNERKGTLGK
jgi:hypothetical protein